MADKKEKLFDQFPPVSTEEWRAKVEADLKGADFNSTHRRCQAITKFMCHILCG